MELRYSKHCLYRDICNSSINMLMQRVIHLGNPVTHTKGAKCIIMKERFHEEKLHAYPNNFDPGNFVRPNRRWSSYMYIYFWMSLEKRSFLLFIFPDADLDGRGAELIRVRLICYNFTCGWRHTNTTGRCTLSSIVPILEFPLLRLHY